MIQARVPGVLNRLKEPYDLILADPPYHTVDHEDWLPVLAESCAIQSRTIVVVGHWKKKLPEERLGRLHLLRRRQHGDSMFSVYAVDDA